MQNMEILYICNIWLITANLEREKGWFHSHFWWAKCIAWYQLNINTFVEWRREYVGVVIDIFFKEHFWIAENVGQNRFCHGKSYYTL